MAKAARLGFHCCRFLGLGAVGFDETLGFDALDFGALDLDALDLDALGLDALA